MYLAEDRILCLKIFCGKDKNYYLKYVPNAWSWVDAVMDLITFIGQRRRWINGSWFALDYVLENYE